MPERLIDETVKAIVVFGSDVIYSSKVFSNAIADTDGLPMDCLLTLYIMWLSELLVSFDFWDDVSFLMLVEVWRVPYRTSQILRICSAKKEKKFGFSVCVCITSNKVKYCLTWMLVTGDNGDIVILKGGHGQCVVIRYQRRLWFGRAISVKVIQW